MASCTKNEKSITEPDFSANFKVNYSFPLKYTSIKNFGAVGNGIADETLAFSKAQDYAYANKIAIFIPNGFYKLNLELKFDSLFLFGENKPTVSNDSLINGAVIIGSINSKNKKNIEIDNLGVWSTNDAIVTGDRLGSQPLNQKYFNIALLGTGYFGYKHGFLCQSGSSVSVYNFNVNSFYHGIAIRSSDVTIKNTEANKSGFTSIIIKSAAGGNENVKNVNVENVLIRGDSTNVYSRGGGIIIQSYDDNCITKNIVINNVKSYHGGVGTINIEQAKGKVDSISINNCYSYKTGDNPMRASFDVLGGASNISFYNCTSSFSNGTGYRSNKDAVNVRVVRSFENNSKVAAYDGPFKFLELNNVILFQ